MKQNLGHSTGRIKLFVLSEYFLSNVQPLDFANYIGFKTTALGVTDNSYMRISCETTHHGADNYTFSTFNMRLKATLSVDH